MTYTCDNIFPSGCVIYTADIPSFIDADTFPCDANLDMFLEELSNTVEDILTDIDLTGLDPKCFSFDPADVTIKELHQEEIDKICDHELRISDLEDTLLNLNIGIKTLTIDLDCLSSGATSCETGTNTYTLLSVLLTLRAEICRLKEKLQQCMDSDCGGSCTSGTSGVSGNSGTSGTSASGAGTSGTSGTTGTSGTSAFC